MTLTRPRKKICRYSAYHNDRQCCDRTMAVLLGHHILEDLAAGEGLVGRRLANSWDPLWI